MHGTKILILTLMFYLKVKLKKTLWNDIVKFSVVLHAFLWYGIWRIQQISGLVYSGIQWYYMLHVSRRVNTHIFTVS